MAIALARCQLLLLRKHFCFFPREAHVFGASLYPNICVAPVLRVTMSLLFFFCCSSGAHVCLIFISLAFVSLNQQLSVPLRAVSFLVPCALCGNFPNHELAYTQTLVCDNTCKKLIKHLASLKEFSNEPSLQHQQFCCSCQTTEPARVGFSNKNETRKSTCWLFVCFFSYTELFKITCGRYHNSILEPDYSKRWIALACEIEMCNQVKTIHQLHF